MIPEWLRPLYRFGTGAGIVIDSGDLTIYLARVRPGGPSLLAARVIQDYRERPAAEWGAEFQKLTETFKTGPLPVLAVLPREQVLLRTVPLPGVTDEDAPAAIRFQLDSLHPYQEEEIVYDWQRIGRTAFFAVAIAEKRVIDEYTALFAEAGIKLAGITIAASTFFSSMRIYGEPPASGVLAVAEGGAQPAATEVYGESAARPLFSALLPDAAQRAVVLAVSELRLDPETEAQPIADWLPAWTSAPDDFDFSDAGRQRAAKPWAAALTAAQPRFAPPLNLLPAELRFVSSRLLWLPSAILAVLLAATLGGWAAMGAWQEKSYLQELDSRIRQAAPRAQQVEKTDREIATVVERIQLLDQFKKRTRTDLDLLLEINTIFPPPAFLHSLVFDRNQVAIGGEIGDTDGLLKKLDESPRLAGSEFTMPLARAGQNEIFRLRSRREGSGR